MVQLLRKGDVQNLVKSGVSNFFWECINPFTSLWLAILKDMVKTPSINAQCRSMPIKIMALIQNASQCRLIGIDRNRSTLGSMPEFWSALIGIDQGSPDMVQELNRRLKNHLPLLIWYAKTFISRVSEVIHLYLEASCGPFLLTGLAGYSGRLQNMLYTYTLKGVAPGRDFEKHIPKKLGFLLNWSGQQ